MSGISGVAGSAFAAAAQIDKSAPKRSSETTSDMQKSDKQEQKRKLDIHV